MKANSLVPQLVIALLLSCLAAIVAGLFNQFVSGQTNARINLSLIMLLYLGCLIWQNPMPAGRVTLMAFNLGLMLLCMLFEVRLETVFWLYPTIIWLNRCLLRYSSILAIMSDSALCLLGTGAALWALGNGYGLVMALWCFLLLQAVHVMIPCRKAPHRKMPASQTQDNFNRAMQSAESALQQLMKKTDAQ